MEAASFFVPFFFKTRQKRYSGQQETAPKNRTIIRLLLKFVRIKLKSSIFAAWKQIDRKK
jgi:hypothetical protein